jgi:hypothetical protein
VGELFEKSSPTPLQKLPSKEVFLFAKTGMFAYRAFVWLTKLVCLHTDGRKLPRAGGHHRDPTASTMLVKSKSFFSLIFARKFE